MVRGVTSIDGLAGQTNRQMVNQRIGRQRERRWKSKRYAERKSMAETGQSTIDNGSRVNF
jgi:hypothetical protein